MDGMEVRARRETAEDQDARRPSGAFVRPGIAAREERRTREQDDEGPTHRHGEDRTSMGVADLKTS
jgi:hypothetical protein